MHATWLSPSGAARKLGLAFISAVVAVLPASALDIPDRPLVATQLVEPNLLYLLDNSGSMMFEIMPEDYMYLGDAQSAYLFAPTWLNNIYGGNNYASINYYYLPRPDPANILEVYMRSSSNNTLYYNPAITYLPWRNEDGSYYGASSAQPYADPAAALWNPANPGAGSLNLTAEQTVTANWYELFAQFGSGTGSHARYQGRYWPMTYYVYKGSGARDVAQSYYRYQIRNGRAFRLDIQTNTESEISQFPGGRSVEQESRNFATWFQYYRSRILAAKASSLNAFYDLGSGYRVGFQAINPTSLAFAVPKSGNFSGSNRELFFDRLLNLPIYAEGTPLRSALTRAGNDYSNNYWDDGVSCRRAFTILVTDGYWSSNDTVSVNDVDGDGSSNTLADVARWYWKTDLSALANTLQLTSKNKANWQHMTTFGLSLGLKGTLDQSVTPAPDSSSWPTPNDTVKSTKIDDLWHAAVNSYGSFVAAANPEEFRQGLVDALGEITQQAGAQSAGGASSAVYSDNALYYQASFDSANWTGQLNAYELGAETGTVLFKPTPKWQAARQMPPHASRIILFGDGATGGQARSFSWSAAGTILQAKGLNADLVAYVRGAADREGTGSSQYRLRNGAILGDIIGSSPLYVGAPSDNVASASVSGGSTVSNAAKRSKMVYIGANDGMLHAFNADNGIEKFAYIPGSLLDRLPILADQRYADTHRYFVDGLLESGEAVEHGSQSWRSYLTGSLGRGGAGLFLLDITQPDSVSPATASQLVMWEFTGKDDPHLGQLHQMAPAIVKLNDGKHYVLAPNGYNSATGSASLFILPVQRGLASWSGNAVRVTAQAGPDNGLGAIATHDLDGNGTVDLVYAGDLKGQVWRFDLSGKNPSAWTASGSVSLLYQARGPGNLPQPISAAPLLVPSPGSRLPQPTAANPGLMVYVGTGRYVAACDRGGSSCSGEDQTQSVYGLLDVGLTICNRRELRRQRLSDLDLGGKAYRTMTANTVSYPPAAVKGSACSSGGPARSSVYTTKADGLTPDVLYRFPDLTQTNETLRETLPGYVLGWYFDLPGQGERVVSYLDYNRKRVEIQTFLPATANSNVCSLSEDYSYILRVHYLNGGPFAKPRFDDETIKDALGSNSRASSIVGKRASGSLGRYKMRYGNRESSFLALTKGGIGQGLDELLGRRVQRVSWREIVSD